MAKTNEAPPLRMRVDQGQLAPTSAWDAERVDSYRNGSIVHVHITQEKNRKLERKYWAILGEVIKSCPVKQRDKEALHKAIRLKLGVVDAYFTFSGQLKVEVRSTSTMDDPEYQRFYEDAMALLHEETGVDPEQLSANSPDVGEDEDQETPVMPQASGEGSDGDPQGNPPAEAVAADESLSQESGTEAGTIEAQAEPDAAPASDLIALKRECISKFLTAATDPSVPDAKDRQETVVFAKDAWKQSLPTEADFVKACFETSRKVVRGELKEAAARKYLEGLV